MQTEQPAFKIYKDCNLLMKAPKHPAHGDLVQGCKPPGRGWIRAWTFVRPTGWGAPRCPGYRSPVWEFSPDAYAAKQRCRSTSLFDKLPPALAQAAVHAANSF